MKICFGIPLITHLFNGPRNCSNPELVVILNRLTYLISKYCYICSHCPFLRHKFHYRKQKTKTKNENKQIVFAVIYISARLTYCKLQFKLHNYCIEHSLMCEQITGRIHQDTFCSIVSRAVHVCEKNKQQKTNKQTKKDSSRDCCIVTFVVVSQDTEYVVCFFLWLIFLSGSVLRCQNVALVNRHTSYTVTNEYQLLLRHR